MYAHTRTHTYTHNPCTYSLVDDKQLLTSKTVMYINVDVAVAGHRMHVGASPSLQPLVR